MMRWNRQICKHDSSINQSIYQSSSSTNVLINSSLHQCVDRWISPLINESIPQSNICPRPLSCSSWLHALLCVPLNRKDDDDVYLHDQLPVIYPIVCIYMHTYIQEGIVIEVMNESTWCDHLRRIEDMRPSTKYTFPYIQLGKFNKRSPKAATDDWLHHLPHVDGLRQW